MTDDISPLPQASEPAGAEPLNKAPRKRWKRLGRLLLKTLLVVWAISIVWVVCLKWMPVFFTPLMAIRRIEGYLNNKPSKIYYKWVDYEKIAPAMSVAVIASEDQNFSTHQGFDWAAIQQAMEENKTRKRPRGASTISQQVAKNVFLWNGGGYFRKGLEAYFTFLIESIWGKQRILEVYLNIAEMGEMTFGVQAASQKFFKKNAWQLTNAEAARLAAVLPNPRKFSAQHPSSYILKRQAQIQWQMLLLGGNNHLQKISK